MSSSEEQTFQVIPLKQIVPGNNPRDDWENQAIDSLASSIKATGGRPLQPLVVRRHPSEADKFEIICGERRYRAAKQARFSSVECVVRDCDGITALELAMQENLNRKDLNPMQIARSLDELCKPIERGGAGYSAAQAAGRFGKTNSWVKNMRRLTHLPERFQNKVAAGQLPPSAARVLVPYVDDEKFLAKIEADIEANPWAYRTRDAFTRSIELLKSGQVSAKAPPVASKRALPAATGVVAKPADNSKPSIDDAGSDSEASPVATAEPSDSAAAASPAASVKLSTPVERACGLIEELQTIEELTAVQRSLNRQRQRVSQLATAQSRNAS